MSEARDSSPALDRVLVALDERVPTRMVPDLDRITGLLSMLGDPQRGYPSCHITGTNGKTTTARMADALLRGLGLRTGRYTSPHLERVTERIAVDGAPLSDERFAAVYDEVAPYAELVDARNEQRVTYFELLTAMAFAAFADAPVDAAVVEVGLGGRWDATNVLHAPVAVATSIGLDHRELLGERIEQIAAEKAGIVHPGAVLVSARQVPAAMEQLRRRAGDVAARVVVEGEDFAVASRRLAVGGQVLDIDGLSGRVDDVFLPLHGAHQASNAAVALAAVESFVGGASGGVDDAVVREALGGVRSPGRLEAVRRSPTVLLDGAHNPAGAAAVAATLEEEFQFDRLVGVLAILADKDVDGVLRALEPVLAEVVATTNESVRALGAEELGRAAAAVFGAARVRVAPDLGEALDLALERAGTGSAAGVLVTGSIVTVGQARRLLREPL